MLLVRFRSEPEQAAVFLDVDGTLAPIVERPEDAAVPEEARAEVARLAERYALVACVSGRVSADIRRMVGVEGVEYVGVHGLEGDPNAERFIPQLAAFAERIDWPWTVENKAGVTLSFHYREAPDEADARRRADEIARAAEAAGLAPHHGRKVLEVRPPVQADKGTAVRRLLAERGIRPRALRRRRHHRPRRLPRSRGGGPGRGAQGRRGLERDEPGVAHQGRPRRRRPW